MKIDPKLYVKYGANTVILPPPDKDVEEQEIPVEENPVDLENISLKHKPLPEIKAPTEKEMKFWEQWLAARENLKGFNQGDSAQPDDATIPPPGKKASISTLLKRCSDYQKASEMIPPPSGEIEEVKIPSSIVPKIENPSEEDLAFMDALRNLINNKKQERHDKATIHADTDVDDVLLKTSKYYDLCRKL